jgi:uridine kinase
MKVALIISGYLRNYENNLKYIKKQIIEKYNNVDVYLHITKNENLEDKYLNQIEESDVKNIIDTLNPISVMTENNIHYNDDKRINNIINHWIKLYKLNEVKRLNEKIIGEKYDLVIRYRPDLEIKSLNVFDTFENGFIYIPIDSKIDKNKLKNSNDGYFCDALAFGDSRTMDIYFNVYSELSELINKYGPISETILYEYLKKNGDIVKLIDIDYAFMLSKCNVFAICGDSGSGKSTLSNLLQKMFNDSFKLECDRYHKWERGDKEWDGITHLNPSANYITKMYEDVFNLKIGNEIFQVDYDHDTGKFTEKQLINPSNNLIVCGLHSLYINEKELYDLKIYMDTQETLKTKWKIDRDIKERGYTIQKVLDNIKKREKDFKEYIEPQKEKADLIVRFFTDEEIEYSNLNHDTKLKLKLSISKRFNITHILTDLKNNGIEFTLSETNDFTKIIFNEYLNSPPFNQNKIKTNDFYDYILYFVFNLKIYKLKKINYI